MIDREQQYKSGGRIRAAEWRSLRLHEVAARRVLEDPNLLDVAVARLAVLGKANPQGASYHAQWLELLADRTPAGLARLARTMTEDSESAAALRRESPFADVVPKAERERIFKAFEK